MSQTSTQKGANDPMPPAASGAARTANSTSSASDPTVPLAAPGAQPGPGAPQPKLSVPRKVVCPVSGTVFNPRQTGGKCPVCGEQVVPAALVAQSGAGAKLAATAPGKWLAKDGNWRIATLIVLVLYQVGLFVWVWVELISKHAF